VCANFQGIREGTGLTLLWPSSTPGLKTEHLFNKCINYLTQRTKSGAQIWSSALRTFPACPACAPPWWHLVQHMDSFTNLTTRDNLHLGLYYKFIFRKGSAHMRFSTCCVFLQTFCKFYAVKHTYHPFLLVTEK